MFMRTDNPVLDAMRYDAERQAELDKLPKCEYCGEPIQDEYCYEVDGYVCEKCLIKHFRKLVDDIC